MNNITMTVIFKGSALNKGERVAGNIQSIKKLSYLNNQFSYISKYAMKHYLFNTILSNCRNKNKEEDCKDWKEASVTVRNDVVQFNVLKDDIFTSAELDAFGYMYTIGKKGFLTRKAPVGITKAISLVPCNGDMAFRANHDSLYKVSFTIDAKLFGYDSWIVGGWHYENDTLKIFEAEVCFKNVSKINGESFNVAGNSTDRRGIVIIKDNKIRISNTLVKKGQDGIITLGESDYENTRGVMLTSDSYRTEDDFYVMDLLYHYYNDRDRTLIVKIGFLRDFVNVEQGNDEYIVKDQSKVLGLIRFESLGCRYKMYMILDENIKKRRIRQILEAVHNGLTAWSSGEDNTTAPLFFIAAPVRVPSPVFHPYVHLDFSGDRPVVRGLKDCLKNRWLVDKPYVYVSERLMANLNENEIYQNWDEFLKVCGLE